MFDRADQQVEAPVGAQAGVEADGAEPGEQREAADQHAQLGRPGRPQHRRGDAHEDERRAPDRGERHQAGDVGRGHDGILTRLPFPELAVFGRHGVKSENGEQALLGRPHNAPMTLDSATCYRALRARDARFDGRFFVAVSSTRIYCRPVCTVKPPRRENCRFYPSAAAAESAGYRPCLRCRPELAPGNASVDATTRVAQAAASLIEDRALDADGLEAVASRLGIQAPDETASGKMMLRVPPKIHAAGINSSTISWKKP